MSSRFHLSIRTDDATAARRFYERLGCAVVRDGGGWFDVDFFGHQLTIHAPRSQAAAETARQRLDHFGVNLDPIEWQALAQRLRQQSLPFLLPPTADAGSAERGKFIIAGPDGIGLEFKFER